MKRKRALKDSTTIHQTYKESNGSHNGEATTNGPFKLRYKNKLADEDTEVDEELRLQTQRTTTHIWSWVFSFNNPALKLGNKEL